MEKKESISLFYEEKDYPTWKKAGPGNSYGTLNQLFEIGHIEFTNLPSLPCSF